MLTARALRLRESYEKALLIHVCSHCVFHMCKHTGELRDKMCIYTIFNATSQTQSTNFERSLVVNYDQQQPTENNQ